MTLASCALVTRCCPVTTALPMICVRMGENPTPSTRRFLFSSTTTPPRTNVFSPSPPAFDLGHVRRGHTFVPVSCARRTRDPLQRTSGDGCVDGCAPEPVLRQRRGRRALLRDAASGPPP